MNNKNIQKAAKNFLKKSKGNIDFVNAENFIKELGYKTIFYNTIAGDAELSRYCLCDNAEKTDAFTYCGTAKIIFIDNNASAEDKSYLLYHEIGHIVLGHLDYERISTKSSILLDIESDTFVHYILNPPKANKLGIFIAIVVVMMMSALSFSLGATYVETSVIPVTGTTYEDDKVYITSSGTKYHRESCIHVQGKKVFSAERKEAEKTHAPCKVCNP